jgi:hypothetical protein
MPSSTPGSSRPKAACRLHCLSVSLSKVEAAVTRHALIRNNCGLRALVDLHGSGRGGSHAVFSTKVSWYGPFTKG